MQIGWWVVKKDGKGRVKQQFYGVKVTMKTCGKITRIKYGHGGLFEEEIDEKENTNKQNYYCKGVNSNAFSFKIETNEISQTVYEYYQSMSMLHNRKFFIHHSHKPLQQHFFPYQLTIFAAFHLYK